MVRCNVAPIFGSVTSRHPIDIVSLCGPDSHGSTVFYVTVDSVYQLALPPKVMNYEIVLTQPFQPTLCDFGTTVLW